MHPIQYQFDTLAPHVNLFWIRNNALDFALFEYEFGPNYDIYFIIRTLIKLHDSLIYL